MKYNFYIETICFLLVMAGKHFLTLVEPVIWHDLCCIMNKKNQKHINGKKVPYLILITHVLIFVFRLHKKYYEEHL